MHAWIKHQRHSLHIVIAVWGMMASLAPSFTSAQITKPDPFPVAFGKGEIIRYHIHYGMVSVGKARFEVKPDWYRYQGVPYYHFYVHGRSLSGWDMFYKVRDHYHSISDTGPILPLLAFRDVKEGPYEVRDRYFFLHNRQKVRSMRFEGGDTTDTMMTVPAPTFDIVSAIYHARGLDFSQARPGDKYPMTVFLENETFSLGVTFVGRDTLETEQGTFRCLVIRPELVKGRVFKGQDDMTVYVTDDRNKIPVLIESKIFIGRIRAALESWEGLRFPLDAKVE